MAHFFGTAKSCNKLFFNGKIKKELGKVLMRDQNDI